ncbi:MAG: winged helix-turn-helix transcriptional regulator [Candidatus Kapabacteria bacterium]|nr:winged helix-turn-helix transcriptional regulator [Ignavibacteriota bacterium]MCW5886011.1 winged helix-turn-helix transcriptional regulator [Candidatus Kapabacteria bacterium]
MKRRIKADQLERMSELLKCIAHPLRLEIIELLEEYQRLCVSDIVEKLNVEQSVISHHLTKLKDKGILKSSREGKNVYYEIAMHDLLALFNCIEHCAVA